MKLERLETLNLISTKNLLVRETLANIEGKSFNKYELEINLALVIFSLFGDTELHEAMNKDDINWIEFMNDNYKLIEELKVGEYKEVYEDIFNEIVEGANRKNKYETSIMFLLESLKDVFTEENVSKITEAINNVKEEEK